MAKKSLSFLIILIVFATFTACHNSSLLLTSSTKDESDFEIQAPDDGAFMKSGQQVSFQLATSKELDGKTLEMEITLTSSDGTLQWSTKLAGPALNEDLQFTLPTLAEGKYTLVYTIYENGEILAKKSSLFFAVSDEYAITGITSFPTAIGTSSKVLLTAELTVPKGEDPFLRWSSKGKVIKTGNLSDGLDQIIWTASTKKGVYPILLELFPCPPGSGESFAFTSSCYLNADLFVTQERTFAVGDLTPEESYYVLHHMAADLEDDGVAAKKATRSIPVIIGTPQITTVSDGFGFHLDGSSGFQFPWLILPVENGVLKPFTVHLGLQWDAETATETGEGTSTTTKTTGRTILSVKTENNAFSLLLREDPTTRLPVAVLSVSGSTTEVPSGLDKVPTDSRTQLSLSVVMAAKSVTFLWFQDGQRKALQRVPVEIKNLRNNGTSTVGGENGFLGTIDELGIYYKDADGRFTCDPGMFSMAAAAAYGKQLVLAEGFDGLFLTKDFTLAGEGILADGRMALSAGGSLTLPALSTEEGELDVSLEIPEGPEDGALVTVSAKDSKTPLLSIPITPGDKPFKLTLTGKSAAYLDQKGTSMLASYDATEPLVLAVANPTEAKTALLLESLLVLRRGQEP